MATRRGRGHRLRRRQRAVGAASLDAYCEFLFDPANIAVEVEFLINAVTTNMTDFFREPYHFDYLRKVALPELLGDGSPGPLAPLYLRRPDAVPPGSPKAAAQVARA